MADNSQSAVGDALALLREELGAFVERQVERSARGARRLAADFVGSNHWLERKRISQWDVAALLKFMQYAWRDEFRHVLSRGDRAYVTELQDWRNKWAHQQELDRGDTFRALDSIARLLRAIKAESQAAEVARLAESMYTQSPTPDRVLNPSRRGSAGSESHHSQADAIRQYALANYVVPWRKSHADVLVIRAGDIVREMGLRNATPNVCSALEGRKFQALANLILDRRDGPRRSTTTTYRYRGVTETN